VLALWLAQSRTFASCRRSGLLKVRVVTLRDMSRHDEPEKPLKTENDMTRHDATRRDMTGAQNLEKGEATPYDTSRHDATQPDTRYVAQLEKRIEEKDETIKFLQEELTDRRAQISGMKEIIDGQRGLLKQINEGFAPVFGALAQLVAPKNREEGERVTATVVEREEGTTEAPGPMTS
jgi:chromosome segregation ATPase